MTKKKEKKYPEYRLVQIDRTDIRGVDSVVYYTERKKETQYIENPYYVMVDGTISFDLEEAKGIFSRVLNKGVTKTETIIDHSDNYTS